MEDNAVCEPVAEVTWTYEPLTVVIEKGSNYLDDINPENNPYVCLRALKELRGPDFAGFMKGHWEDDFAEFYLDFCIDASNEHFYYTAGEKFHILGTHAQPFVDEGWAEYES